MEVLGVATVATELNISQNRVRELIYLERLPAQKLGREWAITRADLDKFKGHRRKPGRPKKLTITVNPATAQAIQQPRAGADDEGHDLPY